MGSAMDEGYEFVYSPKVIAKWRKAAFKLAIIIVSRAQWGQLGAWLKDFTKIKLLKDKQ